MLATILLTHIQQYPEAQITDMVKLIYQNEFGGDHLKAPDAAKSLQRLKSEMQAQQPDAVQPLYEVIGNGLCRLNLRACLTRRIPCEDINTLFIDSASIIKGDMKRFQKKLNLLIDLAESEDLPFNPAEVELFLLTYRERGCPAISHSKEYHALYQPSYRVVLQKALKDYISLRSHDV